MYSSHVLAQINLHTPIVIDISNNRRVQLKFHLIQLMAETQTVAEYQPVITNSGQY